MLEVILQVLDLQVVLNVELENISQKLGKRLVWIVHRHVPVVIMLVAIVSLVNLEIHLSMENVLNAVRGIIQVVEKLFVKNVQQ